jgi:excisionase family DNA binding protein
MPEWLQKILAQPTTTVPEAGRALGISRNAAYEAAVRGEIKTMRFGRTLRVPTAWLREQLQLTDEREAA